MLHRRGGLRHPVIAGSHFDLIAVVRVVFNHALEVGHVERVKELLHRQTLLFELHEKFLSMTSRLRARPRADMLLDFLPFLSVDF